MSHTESLFYCHYLSSCGKFSNAYSQHCFTRLLTETFFSLATRSNWSKSSCELRLLLIEMPIFSYV
jgi:hypothetical protein